MKDDEPREYIKAWNEPGPYTPNSWSKGAYEAKSYKEETGKSYKADTINKKELNRPF